MKSIGNRRTNINFLFASALVATIAWHLAFGLLGASLAKVIYGFFMWVSILLTLQYINNSRFDKRIKFVLLFLIFMAFVSLAISILYPDKFHGRSKWLTLFGNPFCFLTMIVPIFVYLSNIDNILNYVKRFFLLFLVIGLPLAFISPRGYCILIWFVPLFIPFLKFKYKTLCLVILGFCFYTGLFLENTSRTNLLLGFFCIVNYLLCRFEVKRQLLMIYCFFLITLSLLYSIITLINPDFSVFQLILSWLSGQTYDEQLVVDTRSFLFSEISEDLTKNNAWLLGKGADGHYYSWFFDNSENGDSANRITIEVSFLMFLFRGGILFTVGYYALLVFAVLKAFKYAKSRFMLSCAVMISTWVFMTCISLFYGCDLLHVLFFAIVGCCCSSYWLSKDDKQIKSIILQ